MQIKLTCSLCAGEVVYEPKIREDKDAQGKAHASLHKGACAWAKTDDRMYFMAEHGSPVQSEVIEEPTSEVI